MNPTLTPQQQADYYKTQGNATNPLSPTQYLSSLQAPLPQTTTFNAGNLGATPTQLPPQPQVPVPTFPQPSIDEQAASFAQATQQTAPTQAETQQTELQKRWQQVSEKLFGKAGAQQTAEQAQGIPQKSQAVTDLQSQINQLQNEATQQTLALQGQGRGITQDILGRQSQQIERDRTIKALQLNSFLYAAQGNLATAQDMADKAVNAQFAPLEAEQKYLRDWLDINKDNLNRADKKRAEQLTLQLNERDRLLGEQKATKTAIQNIGLEAAKNGADAVTLRNIQNATTPEEAITAAGTSLASATTDVVQLANGNTVVIDKKTGNIIKNLGGAKPAENTVAPGEDPQLYSGLTTPTATAVRAQVGAFKTEPAVQNFVTIQEGRNFASSIPDDTKNPADDQGLIYALAKALDPGSVVREGEYATAQKYAQSWIKAYGKGVEQAIAGTGFLSIEARKNIKKTIETKFNASKKTYDNTYNQYSNGINKLTGRKDGTNFLRDYAIKTETPQEPPTTPPTTTPAVTPATQGFWAGVGNWLWGN